MFTQEKQDLINNKDWDGLIQTDILLDFTGNYTGFEGYTFEKDLILSFFLNKKRYGAHIGYLDDNGKSFLPIDAWKNILGRSKQLNIKFTTEDWEKFVLTINAYTLEGYIATAALYYIYELSYRGPEYLRLLAKDNIYSIITKLLNTTKNVITPDLFEGISHEDLKKIGPRLTYERQREIFFVNCNPSILLQCVDSDEEAVELARKLGLKPGEIFVAKESAEYEKMLNKVIDNDENLFDWDSYYAKNGLATVSDTTIEKISAKFGTMGFTKIINNFSDEQIDKYGPNIDISILVKKRNLSLDKIAEIKDKKLINLSNVRFFTEEEIIKHPYFFDPEIILARKNLYVTPESFRLLNKTWGKRQRYNDALMKFGQIFRMLSGHSLNINNLRYLVQKTGIDNCTLTRTIEDKLYGSKLSSDGKKLIAIRDFMVKYKS